MNIITFIGIGIAAFALVVGLFHKITQNPPNKTPIFIFGAYLAISMWLLSYSYKPVTVILLLPMFYVIYDDMWTKSFNILFPIFSFVSLAAVHFDFIQVAVTAFVFSVLRLMALLSRERLVGAGDSYFILPLSYLMTVETLFTSLFLSAVTALLYLIFAYAYKWFRKQDITDLPFAPFLFLGFAFATSPFMQ